MLDLSIIKDSAAVVDMNAVMEMAKGEFVEVQEMHSRQLYAAMRT